MLFLTDARGAVPLSYVQHQHFSIWLDFLSANKDVLWPRRPSRHEQDPPPLALIKPQSRPARNPEKVLSMDLVRMVASGRMSPEEIAMLNDSDDEEDDDDDDDEDYEVNDFDDERFQESCRSDQSFSGRVSFGGNTFNFSDSESDDEKNVGDDDDDQTEQQPQLGDDALLTDNVVAAIITQTIEVSSDNYCASKNPIVHDMESNQSSWLFSKKDAFVPQFYSYSAAKSKSSKNRLIHSPFAAAATTTKTNARVNDDDNDENPIVGFGKLKLRKQKNKRPSPRGSHLSQENSHGSDSASLHSEISFKSYSRGEGIPSSSRSTYPSTESSYQDSFRSRRNSHVSLSTFHSSEGLNNSRRDLFCLMEDDDGLLAGSC